MLGYILKEDTKRNRVYFILLSLLIMLILYIFNHLLFINVLLSERQTSYTENILNQYIDIEYNQEYAPLYSLPDGENKAKSMYKKLIEAEEFTYYEIYSQFLYIVNYEGLPIFRHMYENGNPYEEDVPIDLNGINYLAAPIKTMQLSNNCFADFGLKVVEGESFDVEHYNYTINDTVPIILGFEYKQQYEIGQILNGIYIAEPFNFEIIGFFEKDTTIQIGNDIKYLDRYIVMPCFNCEKPVNTQDRIFQIRHYGLKTSGILKVPEGISETAVKNIVNKMAKESGLKNYSVWSRSNIGGDQKAIGSQFISGFTLLSCGFILVSAVLIVAMFNKKITSNINTYWAYLVSSAALSEIKKAIQLEVLVIILVSNLLSLAIRIAFYNLSIFYVVANTVVSLILWLITAHMLGSVFINKMFLKNAGEVR